MMWKYDEICGIDVHWCPQGSLMVVWFALRPHRTCLQEVVCDAISSPMESATRRAGHLKHLTNSRRDTSSPTLTLGCAATAMIERFHLEHDAVRPHLGVLDVTGGSGSWARQAIGAKVVTSFGAGNSQLTGWHFPSFLPRGAPAIFAWPSIWTSACDESIIKYAHPANGMDMLHIASLLRMRMEKFYEMFISSTELFFRFTE